MQGAQKSFTHKLKKTVKNLDQKRNYIKLNQVYKNRWGENLTETRRHRRVKIKTRHFTVTITNLIGLDWFYSFTFYCRPTTLFY